MSTKKGSNSIISNLIKSGKDAEAAIVNANTGTTAVIKEEVITENVETKTANNNVEILPEKNVTTTSNAGEEKLPENNDRPSGTEKEDKKKEYAAIMQKRTQKDSFEKTNLPTYQRDFLKKLSMAENIPIQDMLANIVDNFKSRYEAEIKQSARKMML